MEDGLLCFMCAMLSDRGMSRIIGIPAVSKVLFQGKLEPVCAQHRDFWINLGAKEQTYLVAPEGYQWSYAPTMSAMR